MRHIARLILTALVLLAVMTAGAFAASATSSPRPVAGDLPAIVTALPASATDTTATSPDIPADPPPVATPAKPPKAKASSGTGSSPHTTARVPSTPAKTPPTTSSASDSKKTPRSDNSKASEHEVVEPPLHETDGDGHSSDNRGHGNND